MTWLRVADLLHSGVANTGLPAVFALLVAVEKMLAGAGGLLVPDFVPPDKVASKLQTQKKLEGGGKIGPIPEGVLRGARKRASRPWRSGHACGAVAGPL